MKFGLTRSGMVPVSFLLFLAESVQNPWERGDNSRILPGIISVESNSGIVQSLEPTNQNSIARFNHYLDLLEPVSFDPSTLEGFDILNISKWWPSFRLCERLAHVHMCYPAYDVRQALRAARKDFRRGFLLAFP